MMIRRKLVAISVVVGVSLGGIAYADVGWNHDGIGGSDHTPAPTTTPRPRVTTTTIDEWTHTREMQPMVCMGLGNPDGSGWVLYRVHQPDGARVYEGKDCTLGGPTPTPAQSTKVAPTPIDIWNNANARVGIPNMSANPNGYTLTQLDTEFSCSAPSAIGFALPSFGVNAEAHVVGYAWTVTSPDGTVERFNTSECKLPRRFNQMGKWTVDLSTRWSASYADATGSHDVGTKLFPSASYPISVNEARGSLQ